jgi:hypothetical protein
MSHCEPARRRGRMWFVALVVVTASGWATATASGQPAYGYLQKTRTFHTAAEFAAMTSGRVRLQRGLEPDAAARLRRSAIRLPVREYTIAASESAAITWIGSPTGAARIHESDNRLEYFAGQRWLPDDRVTGIGFDASSIWLETATGFARIAYVRTTLEDKSRAFVERVQARHNRWGLTASSELRQAGDLSSNQLISTDNDGLWTAMYVAAECFRYAATSDPAARDNARRGMEAIVRLETMTGIPGFPARSFIKVGEDVQPRDGEWHDTPDKAWRWKGDTSSDEIVGHYFVFPVYFDLVATDAEKPALRATIERITNHILDHDYQLVDVDKQRTRWGWWGPNVIWDDPDETGLRALHMLSHLRVALYLTDNPQFRARYQRAYDDLVRTHRYHLLTRNQKIMVPGHINHSDDELAFLSYYPLLRYETDSQLIDVYKQSLERSWQIERPERNPLWNAIYAAGTGAREFDRAESLRTLQEIPMETIGWTVTNSQRLDVPVDPLSDRFGRKQALIVLPYDELPMSKWNGNPYMLDGGNGGRSEDDGAYFLLPYWMGRYHKLFEQ